MPIVNDIYKWLDGAAPFHTQESWDNSGLLVGDPGAEVSGVLLTLDITASVVREAAEKGANLIISHHPVIFHPLKSLSSNSIPYQLAAAGIAAICAHTNLDLAPGGVNASLAERLSLKELSPLTVHSSANYKKIIVFCPVSHAEPVYRAMKSAGAGSQGNYEGCAFFTTGEGRFFPLKDAAPYLGGKEELTRVEEVRLEMVCAPEKVPGALSAMRRAHPYEEPAFDVIDTQGLKRETPLGLIGSLPTAFDSPYEFAEYVGQKLSCGGLRFVPGERRIQRVAVMCGSGGDALGRAIAANADAFVTGDVRHNHLVEAMDAGITLVDAGHFATEDIVIDVLRNRLTQGFPNTKFSKSTAFRDPVAYMTF